MLGAVSLSTVITVAAGSILGAAHSVELALRLWLFAIVYLGVVRLVLVSIRRQAIKSDAFAVPTLIVGAGVVGEHLVRRLTLDRRYGLRPVGFLDPDPVSAAGGSIPILGTPERLADAVRTTAARHVILAFSTEPDHMLVEKVKECERLGVSVSLVPRLFDSISEHAVLDHIGGLPLVLLRPPIPGAGSSPSSTPPTAPLRSCHWSSWRRSWPLSRSVSTSARRVPCCSASAGLAATAGCSTC